MTHSNCLKHDSGHSQVECSFFYPLQYEKINIKIEIIGTSFLCRKGGAGLNLQCKSLPRTGNQRKAKMWMTIQNLVITHCKR